MDRSLDPDDESLPAVGKPNKLRAVEFEGAEGNAEVKVCAEVRRNVRSRMPAGVPKNCIVEDLFWTSGADEG